MRQEEYIEKINGLINEIIKDNCPIQERWSLSGDYARILSEMLEKYPNDKSFNFLMDIIRKLYDKKINSDYDDFKAIDITLIGLYTIFGK